MLLPSDSDSNQPCSCVLPAYVIVTPNSMNPNNMNSNSRREFAESLNGPSVRLINSSTSLGSQEGAGIPTICGPLMSGPIQVAGGTRIEACPPNRRVLDGTSPYRCVLDGTSPNRQFWTARPPVHHAPVCGALGCLCPVAAYPPRHCTPRYCSCCRPRAEYGGRTGRASGSLEAAQRDPAPASRGGVRERRARAWKKASSRSST